MYLYVLSISICMCNFVSSKSCTYVESNVTTFYVWFWSLFLLFRGILEVFTWRVYIFVYMQCHTMIRDQNLYILSKKFHISLCSWRVTGFCMLCLTPWTLIDNYVLNNWPILIAFYADSKHKISHFLNFDQKHT